MDLGHQGGLSVNFVFPNVIGDVRVARSIIPDSGYQWSVTFVSTTNAGDQPPLSATSLDSGNTEAIDVIEVTAGQRAGGFAEVQVISVLSSGTLLTSDLVQQALNQLSTLRTVLVTRETISSTIASVEYAGFEWTVVFSEAIGNQPAIMLDSALLFTQKTAVTAVFVEVQDGDNALSSSDEKLVNTFPGEAPENYNARSVGADVHSYTIAGLIPGNTYYVAVSAVNAFGTGLTRLALAPTSPPKQAPQPPTAISMDVHSGSASTLDDFRRPPVYRRLLPRGARHHLQFHKPHP
ncbi:hypothetical protein B484DRAFT_17041 [Ochromonadaceae sp. CCMP2298]|nr:hypothetical protein B484DRAFT_17041 [Ochromonadaceae sp. CCMP2298]